MTSDFVGTRTRDIPIARSAEGSLPEFRRADVTGTAWSLCWSRAEVFLYNTPGGPMMTSDDKQMSRPCPPAVLSVIGDTRERSFECFGSLSVESSREKGPG